MCWGKGYHVLSHRCRKCIEGKVYQVLSHHCHTIVGGKPGAVGRVKSKEMKRVAEEMRQRCWGMCRQ